MFYRLGGVPRNRDPYNEKKTSPESDTDSMAEFAEGDTGGYFKFADPFRSIFYQH